MIKAKNCSKGAMNQENTRNKEKEKRLIEHESLELNEKQSGFVEQEKAYYLRK